MEKFDWNHLQRTWKASKSKKSISVKWAWLNENLWISEWTKKCEDYKNNYRTQEINNLEFSKSPEKNIIKIVNPRLGLFL